MQAVKRKCYGVAIGAGDSTILAVEASDTNEPSYVVYCIPECEYLGRIDVECAVMVWRIAKPTKGQLCAARELLKTVLAGEEPDA